MNCKYQKNSSGISFEDCKGVRCISIYIYILEYDLINLEIYKNI